MFEGWCTLTILMEHPHYPTENRFARTGGGCGSAKRKADHVDEIPWRSLTARRTKLNQSREWDEEAGERDDRKVKPRVRI